MISWKVISAGDYLEETYLRRRSLAFPNLPDIHFEKQFHLVLFQNNEIVAGVTLNKFNSFTEDLDIKNNWEIRQSIEATRILRFWSTRPAFVPILFNVITTVIDGKDFLYGIISLPLSYALQCESKLQRHSGWLEPKKPLHDCHWDLTTSPSSEGKKLMTAYLKVNVNFLGEVSGDSSDHSVRVVMGAFCKDVILPNQRSVYATALS